MSIGTRRRSLAEKKPIKRLRNVISQFSSYIYCNVLHIYSTELPSRSFPIHYYIALLPAGRDTQNSAIDYIFT
jgi:hypothetical protein